MPIRAIVSHPANAGKVPVTRTPTEDFRNGFALFIFVGVLMDADLGLPLMRGFA